MKKAYGILQILIVFFCIYFLQVNFFSWFTIAGIKPNLFIILILVLGLFAGKKISIIMGLVLGIYLDILSNKNIGITGLLLMGIGYLGTFLDRTFSKDSKLILIFMVTVSTIVFELINYIYIIFKFSALFEFWPFIKILFIEVIFNILLTIILYPLIQIFGYKLEKIFKKEKSISDYF